MTHPPSSGRVALSSFCLLTTLAAAAPARERTVPEVFTPGDETTWVVEIEGDPIGYNWSSYVGVVDLVGLRAHHFREQALLDAEVPGGRLVQRYTTELYTDSRGRPLRLELRAAVSDVRSALDATFADGRVEARIRQGGGDRSQELEVAEGAFLLANNFVSHLDLALALVEPPPGEESSIPFFSANVLRSFPIALEPADEASPRGPSVFRDSLGEVLHLDDQGRLERVEVPAQKLQFRRVDSDQAPPVERFVLELPSAVEEATDLDREDVRIEYDTEDGPVSLAGTITRPLGTEGPFPAVFFVSGSGGQDRQGTASGIDLGTHEILDRLTREGFLVLRIDDRGVGESTGPTQGMTFEDLIDDARHAVGFLQERSDVDRARIALIGHSEGGQTVPILAAEMDIAAVALMAAPGRPVHHLLREQLLHGREVAGEGAEGLATLDREIGAFFEALEQDEAVDAEELPPELAPFAGSPWLQSHMAQDPIARIREVEAPVLLLQGDRDFQVSTERDAQALAAALREVGHPDVELAVFPELDHLFKKTIGEESSGLDYLRDRPVDAEFLDTLVAWLKARLMP